jgi:hypothetical protein
MIGTNITDLPSTSMIQNETEHILLSFCTLCTLIKGKKISYQNVFIMMLEHEDLRNMLKEMLSVDSSFELVKIFIDYDPLITTSKYITKFLNSHPQLTI